MRKGETHTAEAKKKMREAKLGKYKGSLSSNWKGGLPSCLDCGKTLSRRKYKRCRSCSNKIHTQTVEHRQRMSKTMSTITRTEEWVKKVSLSALGRRHSKDTIAAMSGANSKNWKGGVTPENKKIYKSRAYKKWRQEVFERDNFTCRHCGVSGEAVQAHHIKPFSIFKDLRLSVPNGLTLCKPCHKIQHSKGWLKEFQYG